jgi:hypothetical protein
VATVERGPDQRIPGIGEARHAGVGDERHVLRLQPFGQAAHLTGPAELVEAGQRRRDLVRPQQGARGARVLGGDQIDLAQDADRAEGDVFEVPDRRANHVQRAHSVPRSAVESAPRPPRSIHPAA